MLSSQLSRISRSFGNGSDVKFLSIDPGSKTTGWASFDNEGTLTGMGEIHGFDKFLDWLEEQDITDLIYETYRIRPKRGSTAGVNTMSEVPVAQLIGAMLRIARKKGWETHKSEPANLYIGLRFLGMAGTYPKGSHVPDQVSAMAHGVYYLTKHKIKKHRLDITHE